MDTQHEEPGLITSLIGSCWPSTKIAPSLARPCWARQLCLVHRLPLVHLHLSLTYENQPRHNDLHGKDKAYYQRWQQYVKEFGDDDDMVVVVQGKNKEQMIAALEDVAGQIKGQPQLFDRLFYKVDLRGLRDRALLFLPSDQIRQIQDNLSGMKLLLDVPLVGAFLDRTGLFGWKSLNLIQLLNEGDRRARRLAGDPSLTPDNDPFLKQLGNAILPKTRPRCSIIPLRLTKNPGSAFFPISPNKRN